MPIFPELDNSNETNPFLVDLLVVCDNKEISESAEKVTFKLKPIFVSFDTFEYLFFKKRLGIYRRIKLDYLDLLLTKIKPKIIRLLQCYVKSGCESISLTREIFETSIDTNKSMSVRGLTHPEFLKVADSSNDTFTRATIHLAISSISVKLTLEFVFKVKQMPCLIPFDCDDLFEVGECSSP